MLPLHVDLQHALVEALPEIEGELLDDEDHLIGEGAPDVRGQGSELAAHEALQAPLLGQGREHARAERAPVQRRHLRVRLDAAHPVARALGQVAADLVDVLAVEVVRVDRLVLEELDDERVDARVVARVAQEPGQVRGQPFHQQLVVRVQAGEQAVEVLAAGLDGRRGLRRHVLGAREGERPALLAGVEDVLGLRQPRGVVAERFAQGGPRLLDEAVDADALELVPHVGAHDRAHVVLDPPEAPLVAAVQVVGVVEGAEGPPVPEDHEQEEELVQLALAAVAAAVRLARPPPREDAQRAAGRAALPHGVAAPVRVRAPVAARPRRVDRAAIAEVGRGVVRVAVGVGRVDEVLGVVLDLLPDQRGMGRCAERVRRARSGGGHRDSLGSVKAENVDRDDWISEP